MAQKIIKVGNSAAITIPKEYLEELSLQVGDFVYVQKVDDAKILTIQPKESKKKDASLSLKKGLDPEFVGWANTFVEDNIELFKDLAHRNETPDN